MLYPGPTTISQTPKNGPSNYPCCLCYQANYANSLLFFTTRGDFCRYLIILKPWPTGLASQRMSTQVFDLHSTCVSFGHPLALTCVDFGWAQIRTQVAAGFAPFGHPTQLHHAWNVRLFATWVEFNLQGDLRIRLATHRKSVRKFWFCKATSTCVNVRVRLSRA